MGPLLLSYDGVVDGVLTNLFTNLPAVGGSKILICRCPARKNGLMNA